ncbi:hypothetical protein [Bacillus sp. SDLI1]|uniref:hypothetical protein n=1 Tax=Bacillus sp. SDLI1 TaxID=1774743 RepID=UPI000767F258|nr:hypothetical protein [Bacillus sp. SDLI1]AME08478.1 hypothetical protein AUL54_20125 [Bacillus sp. SDLI1]
MSNAQLLVNQLNEKGLNDIGIAIILMEKALKDIESGNYPDDINIIESKEVMLTEMESLINNAKNSALRGIKSSDNLNQQLISYYSEFARRIENLTV